MTTEEEIRSRLIECAWKWRKTPYHDHAGVIGCGCDCAYLLLRPAQEVGIVPMDFVVPDYSPQQWLNSKCQTDRFKLRFEDTTFLDIVKRLTKREIRESEVKTADVVIYKVAASWTHGAWVLDWPNNVLHAIKGLGVVSTHGTNEGFLQRRERRFFSIF